MLLNCPNCAAITHERHERCPYCDAPIGGGTSVRQHGLELTTWVMVGVVVVLLVLGSGLRSASAPNRRIGAPARSANATDTATAETMPPVYGQRRRKPEPPVTTGDRTLVYRGNYRGLFHRADCPRTRRHKKPMTRREALRKRYRPCDLCNP